MKEENEKNEVGYFDWEWGNHSATSKGRERKTIGPVVSDKDIHNACNNFCLGFRSKSKRLLLKTTALAY